ncbi:hypothetical protein E2C01_088514 [Portunus trituberculatus]|uniref:Uncharacterized protein n=1 Tax=Portunus trituberculatus TaxID=210409 RepID=A0A5B7JK28_PORTR|nr:hypothetical protein [Portunus trituberculatus]
MGVGGQVSTREATIGK